MRPFFLLLLLACLWLASPALAAPIAPAAHLAVYELSLQKTRQGSPITALSGELSYQIEDSCDGWLVEQKLDLKLFDGEGQMLPRRSLSSSWEAKNGQSFRFANQHWETTNNSESMTEQFAGSAKKRLFDAEADYRTPAEIGKKPLPRAVLFPIAHAIASLGQAERGEKMFLAPLFDGTDESGLSEVSIAMQPAPMVSANPERDPDGLLQVPQTMLRMAFFEPDQTAAEPDYEMVVTLGSNLVASAMLVDYGDFVMLGTLKTLKRLPANACGQGQ